MSPTTVVTLFGLVAVAALVWFMVKRRSDGRIDVLLKRRASGAHLAGKADYVEGMQHIPVIMAINDSMLTYENEDLQAELELGRIEEVEYDDELSTGKDVPNGRVMRLRSHGRAFEFILSNSEADKWVSKLPPHRMENASRAHV